MKAENRHQLVRGVVIYSQWRAGCISMERAKDDETLDVTAVYTPWHRHDDDLGIVDDELERLARLVLSFKGVESASLSYEYRDYRK